MGEPNIQVRPAGDDDRAGILELGPRLAEGVAPWRDQAEAVLAGRRWLEESLDAAEAGDGAVLVAADDAGVAGVITIRPSTHFTGERDGYIGELVVAHRAGRRGIGRALVAAADGWAREHGLRHLTLHTGAFNTGARAFYADLGFTEEEVRLTRAVSDSAARPLTVSVRPNRAARRAFSEDGSCGNGNRQVRRGQPGRRTRERARTTGRAVAGHVPGSSGVV